MLRPLGGFWLPLSLLRAAGAERTAAVDEVQPSTRDVVHAVFLNGPTYTQKLGGGDSSSWPKFEASAATQAGSRCATLDDTRYTGYDETGRYCKAASTALDDNAHLLLHSGRLGVVVDAGGLTAAASSNARNLFPKLGALSATSTARAAYDTLSDVSSSVTLNVACSSGSTQYVLGASGNTFVQLGLVRQGHAMTQVTLTNLEFQSATSGGVYGPCETFVSTQQSNSDFAAAVGRRLTHNTGHHCNQDYGGASHPCPSADYPTCVGFVQGSGWGKCWSVCTAAGGHPNLWGELSVWGDSIALEVAWDADFDLGAGCTGDITASVGAQSNIKALPSGTSSASAADRRVSLFFTVAADGSLVAGQTATDPIVVTSAAGRWVLSRPVTRDFIIEVPTSVGTCAYNTGCSDDPTKLVDVVATNPHPTEAQTLRLSFSRNFETGVSGLAQSQPQAEITGLSTQLWETSRLQPSGIPIQQSKNWHVGDSAACTHAASRTMDYIPASPCASFRSPVPRSSPRVSRLGII